MNLGTIIVEIRPGETLSVAGGPSFTLSWRVGIVMNCGEFARRDRGGAAGHDPGPGRPAAWLPVLRAIAAE